jgi:uncharacterized protein with PIN domain
LEELVVVYASSREDEMPTREKIAEALKVHRIIADLTSQPSSLELLKETVQAEKRVYVKPIFRYEWRIALSSRIDELTLQALKRALRDLEVHDVHVENV